MTPEAALSALGGDTQKAAEMRAYHKVERTYLGIANPVIDAAVKAWRQDLSISPARQIIGRPQRLR